MEGGCGAGTGVLAGHRGTSSFPDVISAFVLICGLG